MIKKLALIILAVLLLVFVGMQFFQPDKNIAPLTDDDLFNQLNSPIQVQEKIKASCYDCHSNQTKYPWYNKIAPLSWVIADHVKEGKKEMNFSEWGQLSKREKLGLLSGISEVLEDKSMPLPSYLKLHPEARFTDKEVELISSWAESAMEEVLNTPSSNN